MATKDVKINNTYAVAQSLGASFNGDTIDMRNYDKCCLQLVWVGNAGSAIGTFGIQVSNDATTWTAMSISPAPAPASNDSNAIIDIETGARYCRLIYTRTSGTGTVTVKTITKSNG